MQAEIVRKNAFTQEALTVRAAYPPIFEKFFRVFEAEEITQSKLLERFCKLCRRLRKDLIEGHRTIAKPASTGSGGRLSREEYDLRNAFRRNVYILVRDFEGLKWWPHVDSLIKRDTVGKRPRSPVAKHIADVLHFILRDENGDLPDVLNSAAVVDMANQLAYALRHEVPFQFLIGFLAEVQFDKAAERERAGAWEDWHLYSRRGAVPKSTNSLKNKGG